MVLTKSDYVSTIRGCYPEQKISLTTVIETIIVKYGKDNSMPETLLDTILDILLGEGKDIALTVNTDPLFSEFIEFYYDTRLGEGIITHK